MAGNQPSNKFVKPILNSINVRLLVGEEAFVEAVFTVLKMHI